MQGWLNISINQTCVQHAQCASTKSTKIRQQKYAQYYKKNMLKESIIINYYLFMQHFNICEARVELARGFLGKTQA